MTEVAQPTEVVSAEQNKAPIPTPSDVSEAQHKTAPQTQEQQQQQQQQQQQPANNGDVTQAEPSESPGPSNGTGWNSARSLGGRDGCGEIRSEAIRTMPRSGAPTADTICTAAPKI
ncbi:protein hunchback-like [Schistocerca nitens]|uniref:protein hunchback-like n=1 Tax=Schistocerca nitens TaxID=7011 RepID=UPI002117FFBC|nr:protein hunchback-like [Schistocerca nitens]